MMTEFIGGKRFKLESGTLRHTYLSWVEENSEESVKFVDQVYQLCEENYDKGGDNVVECFTPDEILETFKTLKDVKDFCGIRIERALNCREGTDEDPELKRMEAFEDWRDLDQC